MDYFFLSLLPSIFTLFLLLRLTDVILILMALWHEIFSSTFDLTQKAPLNFVLISFLLLFNIILVLLTSSIVHHLGLKRRY